MAKRVVVGRVVKQCEQCGANVERKSSAFREHVFCSRACYWASPHHSEVARKANRVKHPNGAPVERPCSGCGASVVRYPSQIRAQNFCSVACRTSHRSMNSARQRTSGGYIRVFVGVDYPGADKSGHMLEHRKVMQDHLGRALAADESVHHINGVRDDNRLVNLELWVRSHPSGQRVEDKIRWAREFLARYPEVT